MLAITEKEGGWFHSRTERTFNYSIALRDVEVNSSDEVIWL